MRIIFLDFDGVLVPFAKKYQKTRPARVSPEAVVCLNTVIQMTGAKLVITSSWRLSSTIEKLDACVKKWGVVGDVVGKTITKETRGEEVADWLQCTPEFLRPLDPIESYVILDDEGDGMAPVEDYLVRVPNPMHGLLMPEALRAIKVLEGKS